MGKSVRVLLIIMAATVIASLSVWWLLPKAIDILPGDIRGRIPEEILASVLTPLPTALPASLSTPISQPKPVQLLSTPTVQTQVTREEPIIQETAVPPTESVDRQEIVIQETEIPLSPTATTVPIPPQALIEGLKVIPQKFNNCGPANLTMVLNFFRTDIDQLQVASELRPNPDDRNVSPAELVDYVNRNTTLTAATFVGGDRYILKRLIAQGYPVIIEKGYMPNDWQGWMGHYLTLYGYNDYDRVFMTMDSFLGPWDSSGRPEDYEHLEELWEHFNNTFLVVYPEHDEEFVASILNEYSVQESSMWHLASVKAQNSLNADPENAFAWFNLGSSLAKLAEISDTPTLYSGSAAAFDEARRIGLPWRMLWYRFDPYEAYLGAGRNEEVIVLSDAILSDTAGRDVEETYLYRGLALAAEGRESEADGALAQALRLNPNSALINEYLLGAADDGGTPVSTPIETP